MRPIIYHNPNCGTSRNTLAMMLASGENPEVIEYLNTPYSRERLLELIEQMQISPRDLLRRNVAPYDELQLDNPQLSDDQLIDFMVQQPILVNRPIVVTDKGTKLCRPSEAVLTLLENPVTNFQKEE
ncbi:MAG: arsenate reductase (glutaredoxin) [Venatoribacter sp.]